MNIIEKSNYLIVEGGLTNSVQVINVVDSHGSNVIYTNETSSVQLLANILNISAVIIFNCYKYKDIYGYVIEIRRAFRGPLIVVSDTLSAADTVLLLESGADGCFSATESAREVFTRIRAVVSRMDRMNRPAKTAEGRCQTDVWQLIGAGRLLVSPAGVRIRLSMTEFRIFQALNSAVQPISVSELSQIAFGKEHEKNPSDVAGFVSGLRRKLRPHMSDNRFLMNKVGNGYYLSFRATYIE